MSKETKPRSRKENIVVQDVDGETLIYDLKRNKALCLNETSAVVWQACDGKRTIAQINELLGKQLNAQTNEDIVWLALDQLSKEKLVDPPVGLENKFEGMSRREVVKKIGLGSMIALPMVASLVAPTAIQAQTPGVLQPPGFVFPGTLTLSPNSCAAGGSNITNRNDACNAMFASQCSSGSAILAIGSCMDTSPNSTEFMCQCGP